MNPHRPPLRPRHHLALLHLERTPADDLMRTVVRELVADGLLTLTEERPLGARLPRLVLHGGPDWQFRSRFERVTRTIARMSPEDDVDGWEVRRVARRLARKRRLITEVRFAALIDLFGQGLVVPEVNRWLPQFRVRFRRTPAGDEVLLRDGPFPRADGAAAGGDADIHPDFDATFDAGFRGG